jgi:acyl carrier protein
MNAARPPRLVKAMANTIDETQGLPIDAAQLGIDGTMAVLRRLLAERFGVAPGGEELTADDPLFAVGVGLSSLDGIEFLCEVEKRFGLHIKDLDWWVYETPTLTAVAVYLIELSKQQRPAA